MLKLHKMVEMRGIEPRSEENSLVSSTSVSGLGPASLQIHAAVRKPYRGITYHVRFIVSERLRAPLGTSTTRLYVQERPFFLCRLRRPHHYAACATIWSTATFSLAVVVWKAFNADHALPFLDSQPTSYYLPVETSASPIRLSDSTMPPRIVANDFTFLVANRPQRVRDMPPGEVPASAISNI